MRMRQKIVILSTFALLQACSNPAQKADEHLKEGKRYYDSQEYEKARVEFKNALQINNKLTDAILNLALLDEKSENWKSMYANLSEVLKLDPKNIKAHLKIAQLKLLSDQAADARQDVEVVIGAEPNNVEAITLKGAILLRLGVKNEALALADQALGLEPGNVDAASLKAAIFLQDKNYPQALAIVDEALKNKPDNISLHVMHLEINNQRGDKQAIEQDYFRVIKQFPDNLDFQFALAKFYIETGRNSDAEKVLLSAVDQHPDSLKAKQYYVEFLAQKNPLDAIKQLRSFIEKTPDSSELYVLLSKLYLNTKNTTEAKGALTWIVEHQKDSKEALAAKVTLAALAYQNNAEAEADKLLGEVLAVDARNYEALLLKVKTKLLKNKIDDALADLRNLSRDYPDKDEPLTLMAKAYMNQNSPELAEEEFRKALEINPGNFEAVMPVVSKMLGSKDLVRAEELLTKALELKPGDPEGLKALAEVKLLKKDWLGTEKVASVISNMPKGAGYSAYLSGKISQGQGLCEVAIAKFKDALAETPTLSDALSGMAGCYDALKQRGAMLAYLDEFSKSHPEVDFAVILRSRLLQQDKRANEAIAVLTKAIELKPNVAAFSEALAEIYRAQNDHAKALASLDAGLQKNPDQPRLMMQKASMLEEHGDYQQALQVYEALLEKRPDIEIVVNNLVSLLLDRFDTADNVTKAVKLTARFKESKQPYFKDSYAWALFKAGQLDQALPVIKEVSAAAADVAVFHYHLGAVYAAKGDKSAATEQLQLALKLGEKNPPFPEKPLVQKVLNDLKSLPAKTAAQ